MARAQKDDEVFADRFSAAEFVAMVRSKYLAREPNLQELIEPLVGLGSTPVIFCQVESAEEVVSFVLGEHENEVLAATYLDRSRTARTTSLGDLRGLLRASPLPAAGRALSAIEALPDDRVLRLGETEASSIARTLWTKYNLAREKGVTVVGLEQFTKDLSDAGPTGVLLCSAWLQDSLVTAALDPTARRIVGVLFITDFLPPARCKNPAR
ncbi:hypothetical protein J2Y89_000601 [Curtobacterium herbarum]|uniref:hypothetical protein n=1 Tax=Curtobacterium herbarum TaxID=150122 RepID=UPI0020A20462|nr:hypothetical protein [Curtobacterium herbarum]MCP1501857.1 hypothetical protein [Curtobacterium herbarum]